MEQLTSIAKTLRGTRQEPDGSSVPVVAEIFAPEKTEGRNEYSCVVRCPAVLNGDKKIFGVDAEQALELSEMFIRMLWEK